MLRCVLVCLALLVDVVDVVAVAFVVAVVTRDFITVAVAVAVGRFNNTCFNML